MESWIAKRIRAASFRRCFAWTLVLVIGVLAMMSDQRYIANFVRGPYALTQADLDSIRGVSLTPRYYAHVAGEKVLDTGLRQYRVHTQNGVETSREESGAYRALVFGRRFLVVRTAGAESQVAEGKLVPWPAELESQLFDSKEMRSLRSSFYPFYLDGDSFRRPGYVVIAVGIVFLLLFVWRAVPAFRAWRNPEGHPLARRIAKWGGDPMGVAVEAERELHSHRKDVRSDHPMPWRQRHDSGEGKEGARAAGIRATARAVGDLRFQRRFVGDVHEAPAGFREQRRAAAPAMGTAGRQGVGMRGRARTWLSPAAARGGTPTRRAGWC